MMDQQAYQMSNLLDGIAPTSSEKRNDMTYSLRIEIFVVVNFLLQLWPFY
jgi:hypothetical protein